MNIANSEGFKNSFVIDNNSNLNSNNEENIEQKTPSPDDWLAFFHSLDVLKDINHLSQWNQSYYRGMTGTAFIVGGGDNDIPQGSFGVDNIYDFRMEATNITHVDFMQGVKNVESHFFAGASEIQSLLGLSDLNSDQSNAYFGFSMNKLTDLKGFDHITSVRALDISHNPLTNLDDLSNLTTMTQNMHINYNPNLTDISGLANLYLSGSGRLYVDNPTQYTTKVPIGSTFCNSLSNFTIDSDSYPVYYQGNKVPFSDICN
tara:strand:- start:1284 stop:2063 length:780 start_codon:yes stop_codon:yes gene_type:complete